MAKRPKVPLPPEIEKAEAERKARAAAAREAADEVIRQLRMQRRRVTNDEGKTLLAGIEAQHADAAYTEGLRALLEKRCHALATHWFVGSQGF